MERSRHVTQGHAVHARQRGPARLAALAVVLLAAWPASEAAAQPAGLFAPASGSGAEIDVSRIDPDPLTMRQRLVTIDLDQLVPATDAAGRRAAAGIQIAPSGMLTLNLFDDAVFTGLVERTAPTFSGGQSLSGRLTGIEMGTLTLVVNGGVVAGTVRTPEATYRIRPAGNGLHAVTQVDLSQLPPLGEPLLRRDLDREAPPEEPAPDRRPAPC